jgi:hypothetical protein
MKHILLTVPAACVALFSSVNAQQPIIKVVAAGVINGTADEASLSGSPARYHQKTLAEAAGITKFGTALKITAYSQSDGTTPVNVDDFTFTFNRYRLYHNAGLVWDNQSLGAYNVPGDSSKPDMIARNAAGTRVSLNGTQTIGTQVDGVSTFLILDQEVTLGTQSRPFFTHVGESYRLERDLTVSFVYGGVPYTYTVPIEETRVDVRVYPNNYQFQVSENLVNWYPVTMPENKYVPYPPFDSEWNSGWIQDVIALLPASESHVNLSVNSRRFYRFVW